MNGIKSKEYVPVQIQIKQLITTLWLILLTGILGFGFNLIKNQLLTYLPEHAFWINKTVLILFGVAVLFLVLKPLAKNWGIKILK